MTRPPRLPALAAAVALTCLAALTACSSGAEDDTAQTVTATLLPPIAQPGAEPAPATDARSVVQATVEPADEGRALTLERAAGQRWEEAGTAELSGDGTATFLVDDPDAEYRVVAEESGDLAATTSEPVEGSTSFGDLDFDEAFDGDELAPIWIHRGAEYNPEGLRACSRGSEDAAEVGGGTLALEVIKDPSRTEQCTAKKDNGKTLGQFDYRLNGHVATNRLFMYGVTAARIKFQREQGQHGSFWLQSPIAEGDTPAVAGAEIDIVEYFGDSDDDRLASFIYYPTEDGAVKEGDWIEGASEFLADKDDDWWKAYHVFSLEWTPDEYVIRIDGQEAWRTDQGVSQTSEFIVLSLLSSDYELPNLPDEDLLPQVMDVDWVRHWLPTEG